MENTHEKVCKTCGKAFVEAEGKYASGNFCSKICAMKFSSRASAGKTSMLICIKCGNEESADCHTPRKTFLCSKCKELKRTLSRRARKPGKYAVKMGEVHSSLFKRGWTFVPKTGHNSGRKVILLEKHDGTTTSKLYAKYLIEEKIGRFLVPGETVDHIDNDKTNDAIENLQVLSSKENIKKYHDFIKRNKTASR